jgi:hypothetical protein
LFLFGDAKFINPPYLLDKRPDFLSAVLLLTLMSLPFLLATLPTNKLAFLYPLANVS